MAIISTLRNKMGKFLVFVVGFSIAAFVLGDILGPNNQAFNSQNNIIAEINGEDVDYLFKNEVLAELITKTRYFQELFKAVSSKNEYSEFNK